LRYGDCIGSDAAAADDTDATTAAQATGAAPAVLGAAGLAAGIAALAVSLVALARTRRRA